MLETTSSCAPSFQIAKGYIIVGTVFYYITLQTIEKAFA
jgi:hypothetical protein